MQEILAGLGIWERDLVGEHVQKMPVSMKDSREVRAPFWAFLERQPLGTGRHSKGAAQTGSWQVSRNSSASRKQCSGWKVGKGLR